ncbi:hypothetical protein BH10BAC6_BH10BAC6_16270 [soil metagenome]
MKQSKILDSSALALIAVLALSRLIPHWPNFTPVAAMALFGGAMFTTKRAAFVVPLLAMAVSDLALGALYGMDYAFHSTQFVVYLCMAATVGLGMLFKGSKAWQTTILGGTVASVMFFLGTNTAVWAGGTMYTRDVAGLITCYAAGLAFYDGTNFFLNSLASTWLFTGLLMASMAIVQKRTLVSAR